MAEETGSDTKLRANIAIIVVTFGIVASLSIGLFVIFLSSDATRSDAAKLVMSSLLPLWGTWVGTVLASITPPQTLRRHQRHQRSAVPGQKTRLDTSPTGHDPSLEDH